MSPELLTPNMESDMLLKTMTPRLWLLKKKKKAGSRFEQQKAPRPFPSPSGDEPAKRQTDGCNSKKLSENAADDGLYSMIIFLMHVYVLKASETANLIKEQCLKARGSESRAEMRYW